MGVEVMEDVGGRHTSLGQTNDYHWAAQQDPDKLPRRFDYLAYDPREGWPPALQGNCRSDSANHALRGSRNHADADQVV